MKINRIEIENFLSIEKAEIDFEDFSQLVQVVGVNEDTKPNSSNGAGKSTIIEAIAFALFGKTIRKTTEKSIRNLHSEGKCKVTLVVNDNVVIERVKKPPMLTVTVDGEKCTKDSINNTQKFLESFLNTNQSVFLASIIFGQGNATNFLTASPEEKRTIIQNFLSVSELFNNRAKIKALKSLHNNNKKVCSTLLDEANDKLSSLKARRAELVKMCKNANALLSSEKASFLRKHSMSEIQEMERKYHELELEQTQKMQRVSELKRDVRNAQSRVDKLKSAVCEHCGKVSDHSYKIIQEDKETIKNLGIDIEVFQKQLKALDKELDSTRVPFSLQDFDLIEKVKSFEAELLVVEDHVKDQRTLCESRLSEMSTASKGYDLMRFWETAFSEQGLVKYVIRNILSFFNERSNYYLGFLTGGNFSIDFDDSLHETILNRSKLAFFDTLSGGEKKKISLSVMLALNDLLLLTGKERSNVVFFDEIADSLDEEGIRGLYELIQQITQSKRLFIITHNDYLTSLIEDKADVLEVRKKDYITTVRKP
jgi:DNA repair exonuclease SbcCD ATPase subunit